MVEIYYSDVSQISALCVVNHESCAHNINMHFGIDFADHVDEFAVVFNRTVNAVYRNVIDAEADESVFRFDQQLFYQKTNQRRFLAYERRIGAEFRNL